MFRGAVTRIDIGGKPAGTGFVAAADLVITCAHVVAGERGPRPERVRVVFHPIGETRDATPLPDCWRGQDGDDVAVLSVTGGLPAGVTPVSWGLPPEGTGDGCV